MLRPTHKCCRGILQRKSLKRTAHACRRYSRRERWTRFSAQPTNPQSPTPSLRLRRRRVPALEAGPLLLVRRADRFQRSAGGIHLHRVTRDVEADGSRHAVRFPLRDVAHGVARRDEAVVVPAMAAALAAAPSASRRRESAAATPACADRTSRTAASRRPAAAARFAPLATASRTAAARSAASRRRRRTPRRSRSQGRRRSTSWIGAVRRAAPRRRAVFASALSPMIFGP